MAEWLYRIHRIEIPPTTEFDGQTEAVLHDYGTKGWELVQVLQRNKAPEDATYRLIFKIEKSLTDVQDS